MLHPTGMYRSNIPAQACTETTYPFPARIILSSANANAGYYKQYTIASSLFNRKTTNACQMPRPHALSVPANSSGVSSLYIKQSHASWRVRLSAALTCTKHQLALTLLVLRVLTDYSDTTFSFNDFAFFANWFN